MTFCLPFNPPTVGGGGYRFLRMLETYLTAHHISWTRSFTMPSDVLFVNAWCTPAWKVLLWKFINRGTVVHRVDGWPPAYGRTDGAEKRLRAVNRLAHLTIHQSEWSRNNRGNLADGPRIYNPVDTSVFSPGMHTLGRLAVACVSWSDNPMKGGDRIAAIAEKHPEVQFMLLGRWPSIPATNVLVMGPVLTPHLVTVLQACDALLTMSRHEAGPNHVLEGLACGLPVLYLDSGATRELVGDAGVAITEDTFREALESVLNHAARVKARERAMEFTVEKQLAKYVAEIGSVLR